MTVKKGHGRDLREGRQAVGRIGVVESLRRVELGVMVWSCIDFGSEHGVLRGYEVEHVHVGSRVVEPLERK